MMRKIPFSPPDISDEEIREVCDALRSGWITTGPRTKELERQVAAFCGNSTAVCLSSATACLEMTLRLLGIGPGDEVITSAYTYTASASPVAHVGAKLVLVDTAKDSFQMDYDKLSAAITPRTKAIIPVDVGGILCDYDKVYAAVESRRELFRPASPIQEQLGRVAVLVDAAHSFGAIRQGRRSGSFGDFTTFSFHAVKNFTTAEGGAVTWRDDLGLDSEALYHQFMLMSLHGQSKDALAKTSLGAWEYDIVAPLYKCNMTDVCSAIGLAQMRRFPELLEKRYRLVRLYDELLADSDVVPAVHLKEDERSSCHLMLTRLMGHSMAERNALIEALAGEGIATNVHYKPLPLLTAYKNMGFDGKDYPNAVAQFENEITLPLYSTLTEEDVRLVCQRLLAHLKG
jgi:dTDP-4-amino-4,6-dideoxygalactose transaminase